MRKFKSSASFNIVDRGPVRVVKPEDMGGMTFGEINRIMKDKEIVQKPNK